MDGLDELWFRELEELERKAKFDAKVEAPPSPVSTEMFYGVINSLYL